MQPSKSVWSASVIAPFASGWTDDRRDLRVGGVGREGRRGVARRRARDGADRAAVSDHLLDDRDEHRHAQILEAPGVGVPAELEPEVVQSKVFAQPPPPEQVRVAFVHRDDVLVFDRRADELALAPDTASVGPFRRVRPGIEEVPPGLGRAPLQAREVVLDRQQAAVRPSVHDVGQRPPARVVAPTLEPGSVALEPVSDLVLLV
jgi:hypothetical protein